MRVALIATAIRTGISGGLEGYAVNLSAALGRRGDLEAVVFASDEFCNAVRTLVGGTNVECVAVRESDGSRVRRVGWEQLVLPRRLDLAKCELVHSLTYVAPLLARKPSVLTVPDLLVYRYPKCIPFAKRAYWKTAIPPSLRAASRLIAISDFTRREICGLFPTECHKVHVTPLALDERLPPPTRLCDGRSNDRIDGSGFLLCVGGLGLHKNAGVVLEGLAVYRDTWGATSTPRLLIVGRDYGAGPGLKRMTTKLRLDDHVHFTGQVAFDDLRELYLGAGAVIVASKYEGFGLPALEAMSYGVPVIAGAGGAVAEVVGDAGMLIDADDARSVAQAIHKLWSNTELAKALAAKGVTRANSFSWDRTAEATVTAYRAALGLAVR